MTCMTVFEQPMAMATTRLTCVTGLEGVFSWQVEPKAERKPLRVSWVVVTDERGKRELRMRWAIA